MISFPVLAVSFLGILMKLLAVLFVLACLALILIILVQKGKGGGLSAAFGGGAAGGLLGSKTGDFLTWVTISLVGIFLGIGVLMAKFYRPETTDFGPPQQQQPADAGQTPSGEDLPETPETNTP